ncbi:EAL domain-containing protein [Desulfosporosinus acidiphilus SJ4]|uniref:EAL domain-containing protein n=1 Tax=Desulfosporosinus acidiphilus (strain DSM 22704 / JCM 16185 / SJ4) TaxID=646529 RepID=I4DAW3_DESAJ|nr:EAL domain-containing protein [Desulfosporosinus acidiphilus]AFM42937.1 EAL domain-containing protein [Desulfosporosinus acidiphilus SJ4]
MSYPKMSLSPKRLAQIFSGEIPMFMALQPVKSLTEDLAIGYEALARWEAGATFNPMDVWRMALHFGQLDALEDMVRDRILQIQPQVKGTLFINLHPMALNPKRWLPFLHENVVLEVTEPEEIDFHGVTALKKAGFRIALDDLGTGHATFKALVEIQPEFIKIDRSLIVNCHKDKHKWSLLRALVEHSQRMGAQVVAEGIETKEDLEAVKRTKCQYGQGYLLGYPERQLPSLEKRDST